jgi:hypothetical protein
MAKVVNNFLKGRMNKDLDDRLIPQGEYRNAMNAQVSKSEGENVGALENVLGNILISDIRTLTGEDDIFSIGYCTDEINNRVFIFLTSNKLNAYNFNDKHFIVLYDSSNQASTILVQGAFLNFSTLFPITGVNILEGLLFFTDNRNQPRKINVAQALLDSTYYETEDQISVAKYNPYNAPEIFRRASDLPDGITNYESTMQDVVSKYYPDGGIGTLSQNYGNLTNIRVNKSDYEGDLIIGATVAYILNGVFYKTTSTVTNIVGASGGSNLSYFNITLSSALGQTLQQSDNPEIIFQYNDYYQKDYNGDADFLHDKFVRFAYRFKFNDNEYSIMSPFTQECFIPKQDGYFMYKVNSDNTTSTSNVNAPTAVNSPILDIEDEADTYRSTTVEFMENKVNKITLRIPLPYTSTLLQSKLLVEAIEILYKESDSNNIGVVETISISDIQNQTGSAKIVAGGTGTVFNVTNIVGSIKVGSLVTGLGPTDNPVITAFNGATNQITLSSSQSLVTNENIFFGDNTVFEYEYQSSKPIKTLPSSETTRTYDVVPVKALAQEIASNRIIYGNFQNKHNPPASINYNVAVSEKNVFNRGEASALSNDGGGTAPTTPQVIPIDGVTGSIVNTMIVTGTNIPAGTIVTGLSGSNLTISNQLTGTMPDNTVLTFTTTNSTYYNTSSIEYPNSSLKQNRSYQVGVVLSDRFGRQSSVILAPSENSIVFNNNLYKGSTVFSDYINNQVDAREFLGNSLKVLFNDPIDGSTTGLYNGDSTSSDYNPTGWYSYKIVVKQTEQEYYNVYLPGIMAAYPDDPTKELNKTSHAVLFNDNINKVPRDLTEVGPEQKQFRSSVILHGRVENLPNKTNNLNNKQYYPSALPPVVSAIATDSDLFNGIAKVGYVGSPDFYNIISNPLIGRISTSKKIGVTVNITTATALAAGATSPPANTSEINLDISTISPFFSTASNSIQVGQTVSGNGIVPGTTIIKSAPSSPAWQITLSQPHEGTGAGDVLTFSPTNDSSTLDFVTMPQLAIMETDGVNSNLDIYWETTTSGLINELNQAVLGGTNDSVGISGFATANTFKESLGNNDNILSSDFTIVDQFGNNVAYSATTPSQIELHQVLDYSNPPNDVTSKFALVTDTAASDYNVKTADYFYYGRNNTTEDTFLFTFKINVPTGVETFVSKGPIALINVNPSILSCTNPSTYVPGTSGGGSGTIHSLDGNNGSNVLGPNGFKDLEWSVTVTNKDSSASNAGIDYGPNGTSNVQITQTAIGTSKWRATFFFQGGDPPDSMIDGTYTFASILQDSGGAIKLGPFELVIDRVFCYTYTYQSSTNGANLGQLSYTDCAGDGTALTPVIINDGSLYSICARDTSVTQAGLDTVFTQQPTSYVSLCNPTPS